VNAYLPADARPGPSPDCLRLHPGNRAVDMIAREAITASPTAGGRLEEYRRWGEAGVSRPVEWLFQSVITPPPSLRGTRGWRGCFFTNVAPSVLSKAFCTLYRLFALTQGCPEVRLHVGGEVAEKVPQAR
jgi:hypothetical protein